MSKVNLRRLAKRIHQGLSKDLSLMQIQHLIAQAHGHESWDSVLTLEKEENEYAHLVIEPREKSESDINQKFDIYLKVDRQKAKIQHLEYADYMGGLSIQVGPPAIAFALRKSIEAKFPYIDVYKDPPEHRIEVFESLKILAHKAMTLRDDGYDLIPADNPLEACIGITALKYMGDVENPSPEYHLQYYPYGKLELESREVSIKQIMKLLDEPGYYNCDMPASRRLGVIKYDQEAGKAYLFFCPISKVKDQQFTLTEIESQRVTKRAGRGVTAMRMERLQLLETLSLNPPPDFI